MEDITRLKKIITWTSTLLIIVIAIMIPSVYFLASYHYQNKWLNTEINSAADDVSELVYSNPQTWTFQIHRLEEILEKHSNKNLLQYTIKNNNGELLLDIGKIDSRFTYKLNENLNNGAHNVGEIIVTHDLRPLLVHILFVLFISFGISAVVYLALRLLPFAALNRATRSLIESRKALNIEIEAKELALFKQKEISEKMRFQSLHDSLTELPNRKLFYQHLNTYIADEITNKNPAWIVILDLDRFKEINDALGHHLGDIVLMEVSSRLKKCINEGSLVARLGGDEYAFFIINKNKNELESLLTRIKNSLKAHIIIRDFHIAVSAGIGISKYPDHGNSYEELLRHADIAMYHAKSTGENWEYYNQSFSTSTLDKLSLVADLRQALDMRKLEMYFQPKVSLESGDVVGFESLARWNHEDFGFISPDTFIPIAEQTNMINDLTRWAIETSLSQLHQWQEEFNKEFTISVNISAKNLQNISFIDEIQFYLKEFSVSPGSLTLEITETSIMHDPEQSQLIVKRLSNLGIRISIDDYGTGYSSLAYLKKLEAHEVKIDRSFVLNLLTDKDDQIIIESTINLVHSLGLHVVAEGVEDAVTGNALKKLNCEYAQGYHYCRPLNKSDIETWLIQSKRHSPS